MTSRTKVDSHTPATIDPTAIREMWAGRFKSAHWCAFKNRKSCIVGACLIKVHQDPSHLVQSEREFEAAKAAFSSCDCRLIAVIV